MHAKLLNLVCTIDFVQFILPMKSSVKSGVKPRPPAMCTQTVYCIDSTSHDLN